MTQEITRVDPLQAAKVSSHVGGLFVLAVVLVALPLMLLEALGGSQRVPVVALTNAAIFLIAGVVGAWFWGLFVAALYNWVARRGGGLLIELRVGRIPPGA